MPVLVASQLQQWADATLRYAGLPITPENESTLFKWARAESGSNPFSNGRVRNNPLNTKQGGYPGTVDTGIDASPNIGGVKSFSDVDTAARATAATLRNGYYPDIISMFLNSVPTSNWSSAARSQVTKWGTNLAALTGGGQAPSGSKPSLNKDSSGLVLPPPQQPSSSSGSPLDFLSGITGAISGAGFNIGGGIGSAITGAEQSFEKRILSYFEVALGVALIGVAMILVALIVLRAAAPAAEKAASAAALATPQGRIAKAAGVLGRSDAKKQAAGKAAAPEHGGIRAGGRDIQVTNPESRARLRQAGYAA